MEILIDGNNPYTVITTTLSSLLLIKIYTVCKIIINIKVKILAGSRKYILFLETFHHTLIDKAYLRKYTA